VLGSIEARQATGVLRDSLERLGYKVSFSHFNSLIAGRRQAGRNVIGFKEGAIPDIIAVVAHYDTARTTIQGAADNGAGVGVLLELARVFSGFPMRHSLMFLISDGEEWGMLGAADIAANHPERGRIKVVLSLDGVNIGDLAELRFDVDGQSRGYSPAWLRQIGLRAAQAQGLPAAMSFGVKEDIERALALSRSDQGPFLNAGMPAINLGSESVDRARAREIYHSGNDTIENLKPASIHKYGQTAECMLRSIDELAVIPAGGDGSFRWGGNTYVSGWAMTALQYLTFVPFLAMLGFGMIRSRRTLTLETILREATCFLAWLLPVALICPLVLFCRLMKFLPQSSRYAGPLKDPLWANPAWGVIAAILATTLAVGVGLHFLVRFLMRRQPRSFGASKVLLMTLLLVVVVMALQYNPYWAVTFLTFPALIWGVLGQGRSAAARRGGALMVLAAGFVFYAVVLLLARSVGAGWDILWYATLGLSTGMLQWQGFFLGAVTFVLGLRFLSLQLINLPE
jgi:hypothetical protein